MSGAVVKSLLREGYARNDYDLKVIFPYGKGRTPAEGNYRIYPDGEMRVLSSPMISLLGSYLMFRTYSLRYEDGVRFELQLTEAKQVSDGYTPYLKRSTEPLEAVREIVPEAIPLVPPLGIVEPDVWYGLFPSPEVDWARVGRVRQRLISERKYSPEAREKAEALLEKICHLYGFTLAKTEVRRGELVISRESASVEIKDSFRCVTSDWNTPVDDQVVQKILSLAARPEAISTLGAEDRKLMRQIFG